MDPSSSVFSPILWLTLPFHYFQVKYFANYSNYAHFNLILIEKDELICIGTKEKSWNNYIIEIQSNTITYFGISGDTIKQFLGAV